MKKQRLMTAGLLLLLAGCKKVDEAPNNIEAMMNFMFVHFEDEDPQPLIDLRNNLQSFVKRNKLEAEDGWKVNSLSKSDLTAANIDTAGKDLKGIVGAAASVSYASSQEEVMRSITWPKKTDVLDNLATYKIKEEGAYRCGANGKGVGVLEDFLSGDCDLYYTDVHQVAETGGVVGKATQEVTFEHRWIEPEDDSDPIYIVRVLSPTPTKFGNPIFGVNQQYSVAMVYPDGCQVYPGEPIQGRADDADDCIANGRRVEAFWVDVEVIGLDVPEDSAAKLAIKQMGKAAEAIDAFVANGFKPVPD